MKTITFLFMLLFLAFSANAQFTYTTIDADGGFEVADDNFPTAFTKSGSSLWKLATPATNDYAGNFWGNLWTVSAAAVPQVSSISTTEFHTGSQSMKLAISTSAATLITKLRSKPLTLGGVISDWGNFKISMYVKVLKFDGTPFDANKKVFSAHTQEANGTWQKFIFNSATTQYSSGTAGDKIVITFAALGEDYAVYIDDVTVEKYNQAVPVTNSATDVSSAGFTANWNTIQGATSYRLTVQSTTDNVTWTTLTPIEVIGNSTINYAVTGLTAGANYRYKIEGFDGTAYSPSSNLTTVTTLSTGLNNIFIKDVFTKDGKIYLQSTAGQLISVYNNLGQLVFTVKALDGQNEINLNAKGIFILSVNNESRKIIL